MQPFSTFRFDSRKCTVSYGGYDSSSGGNRATGAINNEPPTATTSSGLSSSDVSWPFPVFDILNLIPSQSDPSTKEWKVVGNITRYNQTINAIKYMGGKNTASSQHQFGISGGSTEAKHHFRVVTGMAPPFVQASTKLDNGTCLTGFACLRVRMSGQFSLHRS